MSSSSMLGGAAMGKMPQSAQPKEEEEPIENFLSCKVRNLLNSFPPICENPALPYCPGQRCQG